MWSVLKMRVYLDNGATTMVDPNVIKVMDTYFTKKYGNASSLHDFGQEVKKDLEKAREIIAKEINTNPEEIVFTSGGTESNNLAIKGIANYLGKGHIITTKIEHHSSLYACKSLEMNGFDVTYLDVDKEGFIDIKQLEKSIRKDTILISIIHANNEIGTIQDIKTIGEICKKNKILFHIDAVQSFTKVPIDIKKINVDLISISSHKIHGPKGIGGLYIKNGIKLKKILDGGNQEFNIRPGTENIPGIMGFAEAVKQDKKLDYIKKLREKLIKGIEKEIPKSYLNGPREDRLANNINFRFEGIEGEGLLLHLNSEGIAVSTGSACSSKNLKPSHVLLAIGLKHEQAHGSIRFTLSRFNTEKEIDYTIKILKDKVAKLRKMSPLWRD